MATTLMAFTLTNSPWSMSGPQLLLSMSFLSEIDPVRKYSFKIYKAKLDILIIRQIENFNFRNKKIKN